MSSESEFAYSLKYNTHFIVRNITGESDSMLHTAGDNPSIPPPYRTAPFYLSPKKTIMIFHYPINAGCTRDLLQIPGVQESDIRASLLKGELRHKFLCGDIELVSSNIDLLQFSDKQRAWLQSFGFTEGVDIGVDELGSDTVAFIKAQVGANLPYHWVEEISLIGAKNNNNRLFRTPDKFLNGLFTEGSEFHIHVKHNGKDLYEGTDYTISESGGPGTGYDTIFITAFAPKPRSLLVATYAVKS
jgi:hypothetical protein